MTRMVGALSVQVMRLPDLTTRTAILCGSPTGVANNVAMMLLGGLVYPEALREESLPDRLIVPVVIRCQVPRVP